MSYRYSMGTVYAIVPIDRHTCTSWEVMEYEEACSRWVNVERTNNWKLVRCTSYPSGKLQNDWGKEGYEYPIFEVLDTK